MYSTSPTNIQQDIHHYKSVGHAYEPLDVYQRRDEQKKALTSSKGITLISVPYWWDGTEERYMLGDKHNTLIQYPA